MTQYLLIMGLLLASQPFLVAHSETPKIAPLEEVYQVGSKETALVSTNPVKTPGGRSIAPKFRVVTVTAYSSEPEQTDSTPFITASGTHVRRGVAASNDLPIGTAIRIPKLFGDEVFVIEDRMNPRFTNTNTIDIWFPEKRQAIVFGTKRATIEVL